MRLLVLHHFSVFPESITTINQASRFSVESPSKISDVRISTTPGWWMMLRKINDVLAQHDSIYEDEGHNPEHLPKTKQGGEK